MLYIAYIDEFGHIGPYISHDHPRHKTHPVFGLGGLVLPYYQIRAFSTFFYQLKNRLLAFEIARDGIHPAKWEKKGASLYTVRNIKHYPELRRATFRLFNQINKVGGFTVSVGSEKIRGDTLDSKELFHSTLLEMIKRINDECEARDAYFMMILDQQEENVMRPEIVERTSIEMFGGNNRRFLLEPPIQAESHLYQTLQCADWLCGIMGRIAYHQFDSLGAEDFDIADKYFKKRLEDISRRSGIRSSPVKNR